MAAPKGNKYASYAEFTGRPRKYTKEYIDVEAKALYEWCQQDDALILREFASIRGFTPDYLYRWSSEDEDFCRVFNYAKNVIGHRREMLDIDNGGDKFLLKYSNWHDDEIDRFEKENKKFESDLKKQEAEAASLDQEQLHKFMMNWAMGLQNAKTT